VAARRLLEEGREAEAEAMLLEALAQMTRRLDAARAGRR
jgi:hypothetical protein